MDTSQTPTEASTALLGKVSRRLFLALVPLLVIALGAAIYLQTTPFVVPIVVMATGTIGGFVGLQRRLKDLTVPDLQLIAQSWVYTLLSPLVGGILALLLYILFLSGLLSGALFPHFVQDTPGPNGVPIGFAAICFQHADGYTEYAKLIFWSFSAGFSEKFVTDVISRFQGAAVKEMPQ